MKRKKKIKKIFISVISAAVLVSGCTFGEEEDAVTGVSGNDAQTLETAEDGSDKEGEESGESAAEEAENTQFIYKMNEDFIVNFDEVFAKNEVFLKSYDPIYETQLEMPECILREEDIVGEFCEGFPEEMQQLLIYNNDNILNSLEEQDLRRTYWADIEEIPDYDPAELPMTVDLPDDVCNRGLDAIDINSDGVVEYVQERELSDRHFEGYTGTARAYEQTTVLEYDDEQGWNIIGQGTVPSMIGSFGNHFILDYEGTKYILRGNLLVCWNGAYDGENSGDEEKPWNVMAVNRELAGYTLNEIYSGEGDETDYLAGLDLENPENNVERYFSSEGPVPYRGSRAWSCGDWDLMTSVYEWERELDGKTYLYVVSDFSRMGGWPWYDLLLTVFEEGEDCMEAVKIYYFAAHYRLSLENVEYDTDWGDMCNQ